jgi:hypothetical protein
MVDNYERSYSVADDLRKALEPGYMAPEGDPLSLNDSRLLTALSSGDTSKTTRELVAKILHDFRQQDSLAPIQGRNE